ncbi:MAG: MBL fold metallo-hydrolase [Gemmatimonadota bacterium]|nr:MBL fold metallo-hydrolase [Gemmatimonadota bacterium]
MKVKLWGVRGSIPTPGPQTVRYGGNTTCMQLVGDDDISIDGEILIIDAGSGIRECGLSLMALPKPLKINILISHTHMDHINGFPFFVPAFVPGTEINIYGPVHYDKKLRDIFAGQMDYSYFPISTAQLASNITFHDLKECEFELGNLKVKTQYMNHPVLTLGYRITDGETTFVYTGDHESYRDVIGEEGGDDEDDDDFDDMGDIVAQQNQRLIEFFRDADILVCDAAYTPEEYQTHKGWGHGSTDNAVDWAIEAGVRKLVLHHHEPTHSDEKLDEMEAYAKQRARDKGADNLEIFTATEKVIIG